jgi:hypothetical protein
VRTDFLDTPDGADTAVADVADGARLLTTYL